MAYFNRGRPAKPDAERRSHRAVTFLTEEEYGALCELAETEDRSVSAFVHRIVVDYLAQHCTDQCDS